MCLQGEGLPPFKWRRCAADEEPSNANISPEFFSFFLSPSCGCGLVQWRPAAAGASLSRGWRRGRGIGGRKEVPAALGGLVIKTGDKETQRSRCNK